MAPAILVRRIWSRVIALYKFLWHLIRPTLDPNVQVFTSLFRRFVVLFEILGSKWRLWYGKQRCSNPPSSPKTTHGKHDGSRDQESKHLREADVDQTVIPLDNISCSLYPYSTALHNSFRSSHMSSASRSSHDLDIISQTRNASRLSHDAGSINAESPLGGGYTFTIQPTSPRRTYSMSSPELTRPDLRDSIIQRRSRIPQISPHPRSNSPVGSVELLSPGEIFSSRDHIPPALGLPIDQLESTELPLLGTAGTSSPTHTDDLEIPALNHPRIYPTLPGVFQRYEKRRRIPKKATRVKMKPMMIDFSDHLHPLGWTLCTHPEGAFYFYNAEKRIFTDVDLHDSAFRKKVDLVVEIIEEFINRNHISIPEKTDLVLDIHLGTDGTYLTDYYFANHQSRIIFFLDHFSSEFIPTWGEIKGVSSGRHLRHEIEAQYWWHCLSYPDAFRLTDDLVCEFRAIVMHYIGDILTSPYANSPYTVDDLYKILSFTDGLKGRYMFVFAHTKFLNFYGQPEARLNRDQSVHGTRTNRRTWFIKTISIFLFSAPDVHLKTLQKLWVDGILHRAVWEASLKNLNDEWREFILYATVVLNANVAFLGTPRIETLSAAQLSSYCSISTSVGSILLGLLLVRQNQTKNREQAPDVIEFLTSRAHPLLGLETLAIMFSLPFALLMWSMVSFLIAFLLLCFQGSGTVVRSLIGSLSVVIAVLIAWCIWTSWEEHPASDAEPTEESLSFEGDDDSEERPKNFTFEVVTEPAEDPQPSTLGLRLPLSLNWPSFLHRGRQSYDSNGTVVEDP